MLGLGITLWLSFVIFGILFAFTFPIWIGFGIIALIYGFATGLMKKADLSTSQSPPEVSTEEKKAHLKRNVIFVAGSLGVLMCLYYIAVYGFRFPPCVYTDEVGTTPPELVGAIVILEKDEYLGRGISKEDYSPILKGIHNEIIDNESIDNITVGRRYFEGLGLAVENLPKGK